MNPIELTCTDVFDRVLKLADKIYKDHVDCFDLDIYVAPVTGAEVALAVASRLQQSIGIKFVDSPDAADFIIDSVIASNAQVEKHCRPYYALVDLRTEAEFNNMRPKFPWARKSNVSLHHGWAVSLRPKGGNWMSKEMLFIKSSRRRAWDAVHELQAEYKKKGSLSADSTHYLRIGNFIHKMAATASKIDLADIEFSPPMIDVSVPKRDVLKNSSWRSINTAPRDGSPILLRSGKAVGSGCYITNSVIPSLSDFYFHGATAPAHADGWRPLPSYED